MFVENEGAEALATTSCGEKAFPKGFGIRLGLGSTLASAVHGSVGQTDDQAANHAEDSRRVRIAHPAPVFLEGDVQTVMESVLNDPVTTLERQHALGLQVSQATTADQEHLLGVPVPVPMCPPLQARYQPRSGEAHLGGRHFQAVQDSDFLPSAVLLLGVGMGARRGPRGKGAVR